MLYFCYLVFIKNIRLVQIVRKKHSVRKCIYCKYFANTMDGCECNHPKMKKLGAYNNLINIHTDSPR